jgi:hypothetical protein
MIGLLTRRALGPSGPLKLFKKEAPAKAAAKPATKPAAKPAAKATTKTASKVSSCRIRTYLKCADP